MPLDGMFIRALANELNNDLKGGRIDTIDGINKTDYVFKIRAKGKTNNLYMSVSYNNPTIFNSPSKFEKPPVTTSFTMFLRKHLEGGYINEIYQYNNDRVIFIEILSSNDLDGETKKILVLELIGRFSNLLILDSNNKIIEAVKQLSVLETNSRGIMRGLKYEPLTNNKLSIDDKEQINKLFGNFDNLNSKFLVDNISGISPILANYLIDEYQSSNLDFYSFLINETNKYNPVYTKKDYYYFDIFKSNICSFDTLSELLYRHYKDNAEDKILKDNNQEIYRTIYTNLKRINKKLIKLNDDLLKDENADDLRLKGELLLSMQNINDKNRSSLVNVYNYYTNSDEVVAVDPAKTIKENSQIYYKKYRKAKLALEHVKREIDLAQKEKEYFELLKFQLTKASLKDLVEIKNELINNSYIFSKDGGSKKKQKPNFLRIEYAGSIIYVGKNNIQNDYITHTLAKKDDLWFHVKGYHGSHVVVSGDTKYSEEVIRYAANLAAKYSDSSDSSSVPVDYTEVKFLKKVPGYKGSFVTYKRNKTIYIDPKRED